MNPAELLVPALRWDAQQGFEQQRPLVDRAIELGVGGFIVFGGPADEVKALVASLRARSATPLLIGADLERGAGQQFAGCTGLPPLAALGWLGDADVMRRAATLTAAEAKRLGINWVYAPVLDLDIEPENPIVGTRAIGSDPDAVARLGRAWIEGCQSRHALACAKHFPGHGRTTADSHAELPLVSVSAQTLRHGDLRPFSEAVNAGVASMMTAHVAYPALDADGGPATLSPSILRALLREELGFSGLIVTDALIMAGVLQGEPGPDASVRALAAGCDMLLYPEDLAAVAAAVSAATKKGLLDPARLRDSIDRRRKWATWAQTEPPEHTTAGLPEDPAKWASALGCRAVHSIRGAVPDVRGSVHVTIVDDDMGGPYPPPSRAPFAARLREHGLSIAENGQANATPTHIIALFGDIRAWKGRPGYSAGALERVRSATSELAGERRTLIVQFSHPRLAQQIGGDVPVVCAWGGEEIMQRAAADWLVNRSGSN